MNGRPHSVNRPTCGPRAGYRMKNTHKQKQAAHASQCPMRVSVAWRSGANQVKICYKSTSILLAFHSRVSRSTLGHLAGGGSDVLFLMWTAAVDREGGLRPTETAQISNWTHHRVINCPLRVDARDS